MNWPPLAILIVTYNRRDTLRGTLEHLHEHLHYVGDRRIFIADDGSDDGTREMIAKEYAGTTLVSSDRSGLGANTNAGLRAALDHSPFVLQLQDDMHLLTHLDLHPHVEKLRDDETSGFIRLWGIGGHRYTATLEGNFWRVDWNSDELYIPSDRPHLKHKRFVDVVGYYPEGRLTAETEEAWCHQVRDKARAGSVPSVLVPQGIDTERSWEHMEWGNRWRDKGL
jgi:glycosyltransferase involved in cell wall biosynthesis